MHRCHIERAMQYIFNIIDIIKILIHIFQVEYAVK